MAQDASWDPRFAPRGAGSYVGALAWDGRELYAGGRFLTAGGAVVGGVARWTGSSWTEVGSVGISGLAWVEAMLWTGSSLYIGGRFSSVAGVAANNVAMWDGSAWHPLSSGVDADVNVLEWDGSTLYVGGGFSTAGGVPASRVASWNGTTWSALGLGVDSNHGPTVSAMTWLGSTLYVGGEFEEAGGLPARNVASWDGTSWSPVGAGVSQRILALAWYRGELYAGGDSYLGKWDGSGWDQMAGGDRYNAFASDGTDLYIGGAFSIGGGRGMARWDGTTLSPLGVGLTGAVYALQWSGNELFVGGQFGSAGGLQAQNVAVWRSSSWRALAPTTAEGVNDLVHSLIWDGSGFYAGGAFTFAGGVAVNHVARWDGISWRSLGSGVDGSVNALALMNGELYVGGGFETAGGSFANHVAGWNGSAWSSLGSGTNKSVFALASGADGLYVGGEFDSAGGVAGTGQLARWDGTAWSAVGGGVRGFVFSLAADGTKLYAGGGLYEAGGQPVNLIAEWDGVSWSSLGSGMNNSVYALAVAPDGLYAGGEFSLAGGVLSLGVSRWDGTAWRPLGAGLGTHPYTALIVNALVVDGREVYVGGRFSSAGGSSASNLARWDGTSWASIGVGVVEGGDVQALAFARSPLTSALMVGGDFEMAGGRPSSNIGRWTSCLSLAPATLPPAAVGLDYRHSIGALGGSPPYRFTIAGGALPPGISLAPDGWLDGAPLGAGTYECTIAAADTGGCTESIGYRVTVCDLVLTPSSLVSGAVGTPYLEQLGVVGGSGPYGFAVLDGGLPPGLFLSETGLLAGTPTAPGSFGFDVQATGSAGCGIGRYVLTVTGGAAGEEVIAGQGLGLPNPNRVRVCRPDGSSSTDFHAYGAGAWGVNVASGRVDGTAWDAILTGPGCGPTLGPQVRAFRADGSAIGKVNFFAYGTMKYGVNVDGGDVDGDGFDEIVTGAGPGGVFGPHVRGWSYDGDSLASIPGLGYYAYATLQYGANVAVARAEADARQELLTGPGPGPTFGSQVRGWRHELVGPVTAIGRLNFFAIPGRLFGVDVAGGDVDADGFDEIATAPGAGPSNPLRAVGYNYDASAIAPVSGFDVTIPATFMGGNVGFGDLNGDTRQDLLVGAGRSISADSTVRPYLLGAGGLAPLSTIHPFPEGTYGVTVAGGSLAL